MKTNVWQLYWIAWIVAFLIPESIALWVGNKQTLSETVWRWAGVQTGVPFWHWTALHLFILFLMGWLFFHFSFRLFT